MTWISVLKTAGAFGLAWVLAVALLIPLAAVCLVNEAWRLLRRRRQARRLVREVERERASW